MNKKAKYPVCVTYDQMMFAQPCAESDHFHHISLVSNAPFVIGKFTNIFILAVDRFYPIGENNPSYHFFM